MKFLRTDSSHKDFIALVALLDADLAQRDGEDHAFYHQYNSIADLNHTLVLYTNDLAVGCGAIKQFDDESMEVKRMFVLHSERAKGYATEILHELEKWAKDLGNRRCVLETGKRQPEAVKLYTKNGYRQIANYGQYVGITNSICFEKAI